MEEILPGVFHWTAFHEGIRSNVHSYYVDLEGGAALIDPMAPDEGVDWFGERAAPERIVLTNRHHYRHSDRFRQAYGCPVLCHEAGLHQFEGGPPVEGFRWGDTLMPGLTALEVGVLCDEETALHIDAGDGALSFADAVVRGRGGSLGLVSDPLLGDDPEAVKRGIRRSCARLLDEEFDSVLMAHGEPVVGGGKEALRRFAEGS